MKKTLFWLALVSILFWQSPSFAQDNLTHKASALKIYECTNPIDGPDQQAESTATIAVTDDNMFMGALKTNAKDWTGYTYGLNARYTYKKGDREYSISVSNRQYSKLATGKSIDDPAAAAAADKLLSTPGINEVETESFLPANGNLAIQTLAVTDIEGSYQFGHRLRIRIIGGLQVKDVTGDNYTTVVQKTFHHWVKGSPYEYIPASGSGVTTATTVINDPGYPSTNLGIVSPGFQADPQLENMSKYSVQAGAAVGTHIDVVGRGECIIEMEAGGVLSTEGKNIAGPNTNVGFSAIAKGVLFRTRHGDPRLQAEMGGIAMYFPTKDGVDQKSLGSILSFRIQSDHRLTHRLIMAPYMRVEIPMGRQVEQYMQDKDLLQTMGFDFKF